jgi:acetyl-CoA carboxylase biotin carboxyl carrier protein
MICMKRRSCMDIKDLKSLIKMVTDTDITEFKLEMAGEKVCIRRGKAPEMVSYAVPQPLAIQQAVTEAPPKDILRPSGSPVSDTAKSITSPIVGTLYRSPAPDAPPYVEVGQIVEKGQVLCIVEAMKLMNEIEAEYRCRISKICKENAQPVEYGETLFLVEPL